jgi:hypothetical protein
MRIYLCSRFSRIKELRTYAVRLEDLGHEIVSTWVFRKDDNCEDLDSAEAQAVCLQDLADVLRCDTLISWSEPNPRKFPTTNRGARHAEFGAALATGKALYVIGEPEMIFHVHPSVKVYPSFSDLDRELSKRPTLKVAA